MGSDDSISSSTSTASSISTAPSIIFSSTGLAKLFSNADPELAMGWPNKLWARLSKRCSSRSSMALSSMLTRTLPWDNLGSARRSMFCSSPPKSPSKLTLNFSLSMGLRYRITGPSPCCSTSFKASVISRSITADDWDNSPRTSCSARCRESFLIGS